MNNLMASPAQGHYVKNVIVIVAVSMMILICLLSTSRTDTAIGTRHFRGSNGIHYGYMRSMLFGMNPSPFSLDVYPTYFAVTSLIVSVEPSLHFLSLFRCAEFVFESAFLALVAITVSKAGAQSKFFQGFDLPTRPTPSQVLRQQFGTFLSHPVGRPFARYIVSILYGITLHFLYLITAFSALATIAILNAARLSECSKWLDFATCSAATQTLRKQSDTFFCSSFRYAFHTCSPWNAMIAHSIT